MSYWALRLIPRMAKQARFMPITAEVARLLRPDDRFISAFPRSGSRWLANLISHAVSRSLDLEVGGLWDATNFDDGPFASGSKLARVSRVVADLHMPRLDRDWYEAQGASVLLRIHDLTQIQLLPDARIVYVFRAPEDALSSWLHYERIRNGDNSSARGFCRKYLPHWKSQVQLALSDAKRRPSRIRFCRYESLVQEPELELGRALRFLDIKCSDEVQKDAGRCFKRYVEELNANRAQQPWAAGLGARGRPGRAAIELDAEIRLLIEQQARDLYEQACRAALSSRSS